MIKKLTMTEETTTGNGQSLTLYVKFKLLKNDCKKTKKKK